ncbi:DUF2514 family protein [Variovorax sp. SRS16]|uniref:DUF2514 family protein n=1 Tax=Variovorax sp. SRS16 TaxID=282217 RepID=UPI0013A54630|nr:DUF2514 family protein [Variovorax sp. SRS16]
MTRSSHLIDAPQSARADLSDYKATAAESARLAERAERVKEERWNADQRKALDDAASQTRTALADIGDARAAGDRLRLHAQPYAAASAASGRASALERSAAAADPIGVLADVLGRCSQRIEILAGHADRSRIAGLACERSYDALAKP